MADTDRIAPPWWLKPMNKFYMAVMGLGLGAEASMVLSVPGRKSGKPRSTPITVFSVDSKRYVLGGFPGADWVLNARAAEVATLSRGRRSEQVRMVGVERRGRPPAVTRRSHPGSDGHQLHEERRSGDRRQAGGV